MSSPDSSPRYSHDESKQAGHVRPRQPSAESGAPHPSNHGQPQPVSSPGVWPPGYSPVNMRLPNSGATAPPNTAPANTASRPMANAPKGQAPEPVPRRHQLPEQKPFSSAPPVAVPAPVEGEQYQAQASLPSTIPVGSPVGVPAGHSQTPPVGPTGPAPQPVNVPGQDSTTASFSQRAQQILGPPLMVLEPASTGQRFYRSIGGPAALYPMLAFGILLPAVVLIAPLVVVLDGNIEIGKVLGLFLAVALLLWLPLTMYYINRFLISKSYYASLHHGGIFVRQAKTFFFTIDETSIPFAQIADYRTGLQVNGLVKAAASLNPIAMNNIQESSSGDLTIYTRSRQKIKVLGFGWMFTEPSVRQFYQLLNRYCRR